MAGDGPVLTERGRWLADELAACHHEIELTRDFEHRERCDELAADAGVHHVDEGTKRTVYVVGGDLVRDGSSRRLKVAHSLMGYYENRCEVAWWERMPDEARRYFAPVLDHDDDHGWVLMPAADREPTGPEARTVWRNLDDVGWVGEDVDQTHQLGVLDGEVVVVDYGRGAFVTADGE